MLLRLPHESPSDKTYQLCRALMMVAVPLVLVTIVLYVLPSISSNESIEDYTLTHHRILPDNRASSFYAIFFDAGSHIHVFHFNRNFDLVHIGKDLELLVQVLAFNGKPMKNLKSLATMVENCDDEFLKFDLEYQQANYFIDEKNYILMDVKKEKEIGFSMPVCLAQARQTPLLKGNRVYITPQVKPNKKVVATL
ncbi:hypothetical protein S83_032026 [Arachis hypogaea]|nr:Nucleoside-triphosphatase [Arachis hypogaea]